MTKNRVKQRRLRRYFVTGLAVITPVGLTAFVLVWTFRTLDSILGQPIEQSLNFKIPGLGFVLLALVVLGVGWVAHLAVGRKMLHIWNDALLRFPLTGRIYNTISQIVQGVLANQKRIFQRVVLVPYPGANTWVVGFVTNEDSEIAGQVVGEKCLSVFVPTTPNPTSGFLILVPLSKTRALPVSVEEAMKLVISAGTVQPSQDAGYIRPKGLDVDTLLER